MSSQSSDPSVHSGPAARRVAVIGGGPAGLMAAEVLAGGCASVDLFDAMPSVGRKFLLAGKGGLNLTHSEPIDAFVRRYGERHDAVAVWLQGFGPVALRAWAQGLGVDTFVGSSGRVFPADMKAAPLLRAWLHRLRGQGVRLHTRHRWLGWAADGACRFHTPTGEVLHAADATLLALGGASWARLGSDGAWLPWLRAVGADVAPLQPSNCGFDVGWSAVFAQRAAGQPIKAVVLRFTDSRGRRFDHPGEFVITATGIEGSLVYAASALIRDEISATGQATIELDLLPGRSLERLGKELAQPRGSRTVSEHLRRRAGLDPVRAGLLRESLSSATLTALVDHDAAGLALQLKAWPLTLTAARPIDEAISTAGGVRLETLDAHLMLRAKPGVFCAGEMLDWEAPTGGYLLTAAIASARVAADGALRWLARPG